MSTREGAGSAYKESTHNVMAPKDTVASSSKKTMARGQGAANAARKEKAVNAAGGVETVNAVGGREAANALFKKGQVAGARDAYMSLMANEADQAELAALHNNLSACYKRLGDDEGAIRHAKECLERDPVHAKSHLRLAQMCIGKEHRTSKHREVDARKHLMAAAALLGQRHSEVAPLLEKAEERNVTIVLAKTTFDVSSALWSVCLSKELIIMLLPGTYDMSNDEPLCPIAGAGVKVWILGLGRVLFIKGLDQILFVTNNASGRVENLVIHGTPEKSSMSSFGCEGAFLHLKGCRFQRHGVLTVASRGVGLIDECHFEKMDVHGAEVRSSGSLFVKQCHFEQCVRGLVASGGAKLLCVESTVFEACEKEAMFLTGELTNAASSAIDDKVRPHQRREAEQKVPMNKRHHDPVYTMLDTSEAARKMAMETGTAGLLSVRVERCHFRLNKMQAVACGDGARAELLGCLFERTNDSAEAKLTRSIEQMRIGFQARGIPIPQREVMKRLAKNGVKKPSVGVFIRGGASVRMTYCAFNANDTAVYIDYNFDACVRLEKCAFYANNEDVSECLKPDVNGMWSKPAIINEKRTLARAEEVPTLEFLCAAVDVFEPTSLTQPRAAPLPAISGNPARCSFEQADPSYYPIGNTCGYDVLQHSISERIQTAIFLACGDIRNVAETLAGWWDRHADDNARVELTMNDASLSILARNIILLELLARGVSSTIVRDVWGAATWNASTHHVFKDTLARARESWLECDADVEAVMRAWANATLQPKHVVETIPYFSLERGQATKLTCQDVGETHREEVERYLSALTFDAGSTMHANPTLLEGEGLKPSMYPTSSLFRAIGPLCARRKMLGSTLLRHIESYVLRCGAALRSGRVHIRVFHGDAFDFPLRPRADVVEMSNLADYAGFANVLLLGARCGNRIFAQSMHRRYELSHTKAQEQFFLDCFGISSVAFSDLIGLERVRADVCSSGVLRTEWVRAPRNTHAVPRALNAAKLAKHMCAPVQEYRSGGVSANTGVTCAALVGPRICEAIAPSIAQAECSLMVDTCVRTLRIPCSNMDYFAARLNFTGTFAVAITEFSPAVGDVLRAKTIRSLFHVVRFHDVGPCVDVLAPAKFSCTGYAALVQCNANIVCVAEPKEVELLTDVGPAPSTLRALSCYAEENYPFIDGRSLKWRLVGQRRMVEDGEAAAEVDVAFPPGTRGVDVVAEGDTLVFSADGETVLTVTGDAPFGARKKALSSPKLGLLTCSFLVVNTSRVRGG